MGILTKTLLILCCVATYACGAKSNDPPVIAHYVVSLKMLGSYPPGQNTTFSKINFAIAGCARFSGKELFIEPAKDNSILNLLAFDSGCSLTMTSLDGLVENIPTTFIPQSSSTPDIYCNTVRSLCFEIETSTRLPSILQETGTVEYSILPYSPNDSIATDSVILPSGATQTPALLPISLSDLGDGNPGKRKVGVILSCEVPLVFWGCGPYKIKEHLFRLIPWPKPMLSESQLFALVQISSDAFSPNEGHYYGNGVRLTFELDALSTDWNELLLIERAGTVLRYFHVGIK